MPVLGICCGKIRFLKSVSGNHVRAVDFSGYLVRSIVNKVSELLFYSFHIKGEKKKSLNVLLGMRSVASKDGEILKHMDKTTFSLSDSGEKIETSQRWAKRSWCVDC